MREIRKEDERDRKIQEEGHQRWTYDQCAVIIQKVTLGIQKEGQGSHLLQEACQATN